MINCRAYSDRYTFELLSKQPKRRLNDILCHCCLYHFVVDFQAAINRFIREYNAASPKPFIWKANPDDITAARNRGFQTLGSILQFDSNQFNPFNFVHHLSNFSKEVQMPELRRAQQKRLWRAWAAAAVLFIAQTDFASAEHWRGESQNLVAQASPISPEGNLHRFAGFSLSAPAGWKASIARDMLTLTAPDKKRFAMIWWWFPDEPLLGYPDIVLHRKVTVAGQPALWIHSRSGGRDKITVTLDKARADRRRWHLLFEAEAGIKLDRGDPALDTLLATLTLETSASKPKTGLASPDVDAPKSVPQYESVPRIGGNVITPSLIELGRIWIDNFSCEVPSGWAARLDEGLNGLVMSRPDGGAQIMVSFWPQELQMPSAEIESMENIIMLGAPATRLNLRMGNAQATHLFFDEPRRDGARLNILYRTNGEPVLDGWPLFELFLASLERGQAPPKGSSVLHFTTRQAAPADPFEGVKMDELGAAAAQ